AERSREDKRQSSGLDRCAPCAPESPKRRLYLCRLSLLWRGAKTSDERDALLHELARTVELEASHQFGTDPALGAVWCAAAHEAACARLRAVGWYGPQAYSRPRVRGAVPQSGQRIVC